jgi:hypothetical protein
MTGSYDASGGRLLSPAGVVPAGGGSESYFVISTLPFMPGWRAQV